MGELAEAAHECLTDQILQTRRIRDDEHECLPDGFPNVYLRYGMPRIIKKICAADVHCMPLYFIQLLLSYSLQAADVDALTTTLEKIGVSSIEHSIASDSESHSE